jgi:hypothetical protein
MVWWRQPVNEPTDIQNSTEAFRGPIFLSGLLNLAYEREKGQEV